MQKNEREKEKWKVYFQFLISIWAQLYAHILLMMPCYLTKKNTTTSRFSFLFCLFTTIIKKRWKNETRKEFLHCNKKQQQILYTRSFLSFSLSNNNKASSSSSNSWIKLQPPKQKKSSINIFFVCYYCYYDDNTKSIYIY